MGFRFKQPLVGEKRCVTTLIMAAEETNCVPIILVTFVNHARFICRV